MKLKDLLMDKLELTDATRALMVGILESIDMTKLRERFYDHYTNSITDAQRVEVEKMFQDMEDSIKQPGLMDEIGDYLVELGFPDAFDELLNAEEDPAEESDEE